MWQPAKPRPCKKSGPKWRSQVHCPSFFSPSSANLVHLPLTTDIDPPGILILSPARLAVLTQRQPSSLYLNPVITGRAVLFSMRLRFLGSVLLRSSLWFTRLCFCLANGSSVIDILTSCPWIRRFDFFFLFYGPHDALLLSSHLVSLPRDFVTRLEKKKGFTRMFIFKFDHIFPTQTTASCITAYDIITSKL